MPKRPDRFVVGVGGTGRSVFGQRFDGGFDCIQPLTLNEALHNAALPIRSEKLTVYELVPYRPKPKKVKNVK